MKKEEIEKKVTATLSAANAELKKITEGEFPFKFAEVEMSAEVDSVGVYVRSGATPVVSAAYLKNPGGALSLVEAEVRDVVEATRAAVERRSHLKAEADKVKAEGETRRKAKEALRAAGLDAGIAGVAVDAQAAEAVKEAARKAVEEENRKTDLALFKAGGGYHAAKLTLKVYDEAGCLIVGAGGRPCLITRFPKVGNAKTLDKMVRYMKADIQALAESRRAYLMTAQIETERAEHLRKLAAQHSALEAEIACF